MAYWIVSNVENPNEPVRYITPKYPEHTGILYEVTDAVRVDSSRAFDMTETHCRIVHTFGVKEPMLRFSHISVVNA